MSLFHIRDWPRPCYYIKNDNNTKTKIRNSKCRGFFIVRVVLDDACRVGIFPTFCRPFETRWCSDMIMQILDTSLGPVVLGNGPQFWEETKCGNGRIPWTSNLFHWDDLWVPSALQRHTLGRFRSRKKKRENLFPRNLSPGVLLMFSSLGGYRWRSPSDRLVRYNEILVLLPPSSIQKCQERRNWCTTSKGALYSGCWTLFDWGEDSIGRNDLESIPRLFSINTLDSFLPSRWIKSLWIPC